MQAVTDDRYRPNRSSCLTLPSEEGVVIPEKGQNEVRCAGKQSASLGEADDLEGSRPEGRTVLQERESEIGLGSECC